jgi:hypothetical protein
MKEVHEMIEPVTIPIDQLIENGVYMTHSKDLVQIKKIDKEKNILHVYNITDSCNVFPILSKHNLVKRIR